MESLDNQFRRLESEKRLNETSASSDLSWKDMYEAITKRSPETTKQFNMKEWQEKQPRTFTEMFNETGEKLSENKTFAQIYEGIVGIPGSPKGNLKGAVEEIKELFSDVAAGSWEIEDIIVDSRSFGDSFETTAHEIVDFLKPDAKKSEVAILDAQVLEILQANLKPWRVRESLDAVGIMGEVWNHLMDNKWVAFKEVNNEYDLYIAVYTPEKAVVLFNEYMYETGDPDTDERGVWVNSPRGMRKEIESILSSEMSAEFELADLSEKEQDYWFSKANKEVGPRLTEANEGMAISLIKQNLNYITSDIMDLKLSGSKKRDLLNLVAIALINGASAVESGISVEEVRGWSECVRMNDMVY